MAALPEVAFSRFFQEHFPYVPPVRPEDPDPRLFRGRHDLSGMPSMLQEQLRLLQEAFNEALRNEKQGVPEHVDHPPFHVDYVDSSIQNALAFRYEGYSFIAVTVPLIYAISDVCLLLSKSTTVATLLHVNPSVEDYNALHAVLFHTLTNFVVTHEWAHHVHGHVCGPSVDAISPNEIMDTDCDGSMRGQIAEAVADGYAIYHVLVNLFDGSGRSWLSALELESATTGVQDEALLSVVIVSVGAYLFMRPAHELNQVDVYNLTHPPQVARMDLLRQEITHCCRHNRPELMSSMTKIRFQQLMNAAVAATLGTSAAQVWGNQSAFLQSEAGGKYFTALAEGVNLYKQSWGNRA